MLKIKGGWRPGRTRRSRYTRGRTRRLARGIKRSKRSKTIRGKKSSKK